MLSICVLQFFQILNKETNLNVSEPLSSSTGVGPSFKKHTNIKMNGTKDFSNYTGKNYAINNTFSIAYTSKYD